MKKPLSRAFNAAVWTMANLTNPKGWDVGDGANSLEELDAQIARDGRITVSGAYSDQTIYADPETNFAARAWHDWTHYTYRHAFTEEGERATFEDQKLDLLKRYGPGPQTEHFILLLKCEVVGQVEYFVEHGDFPADQVAFTRKWLAHNV